MGGKGIVEKPLQIPTQVQQQVALRASLDCDGVGRRERDRFRDLTVRPCDQETEIFAVADDQNVGHDRRSLLVFLSLPAREVRSTRRGRDRNAARATLGQSLAVSAFPRYVPA